MNEVRQVLRTVEDCNRWDAFNTFQQYFQAFTVVGSHSSYVAILDDTTFIFAPPDDWNKIALSKLDSDFPHAPDINLIQMSIEYNVFQAPVYEFLGDDTHGDFRRLQRFVDNLEPDDLFVPARIYARMKRSKNQFLFSCSRILKHVIRTLPAHSEYEFYFDVQPRNIAIGKRGELLAYDLFNIEKCKGS
jgi:hypothetical protein